jgi:hypothetical protein
MTFERFGKKGLANFAPNCDASCLTRDQCYDLKQKFAENNY